jgi:hypothetical protein
VREAVFELPFAADCCPCVEKLRTVLPVTVGIRDGAVQMVSTLGSAVMSAGFRLHAPSRACARSDLAATMRPNHESLSQNVILIGWHSVRQCSSFLSLRTVVLA